MHIYAILAYNKISKICRLATDRILPIAKKVAAFVQNHPYLFFGGVVGLTIGIGGFAGGLVSVIVIKAVTMATTALAIRVFYKIITGEEHQADLKRLLIIGSLLQVAIIVVNPISGLFSVLANSGCIAGTAIISHFVATKQEGKV